MKLVFVGSSLTMYVSQLSAALSPHVRAHLVLLEVDHQVASTPDEEVKLLQQVLPAEVTLRLMDMKRKRDPRTLLDVCRTAAYIRSLTPDVIHVQDPSDYRIWLMLKTVFSDVPVVSTVHDVEHHTGEEFRGRGEKTIVKRALRNRANALIVHSERLKQALLDSDRRVSADSVYVIPHGTYSLYTQWQRSDVAEEDATVLFFGRIWPYKGLEYLIQAVPIIEDRVPSIKVIIAGEGEDFARYQRVIHDPARFEVHNYHIPLREIARLFQRSSVVALPYVEASQSGVMALAYAFGKPVVATDVGSLSEVVEHGKTGLLVPPRDVQSLANALVCLLQNPELRHAMGRRAYGFGQSVLGWQRIAEQTMQVYEGIVK